MISFLLGSVMGITAMQAGIDTPRKNFVTCLHAASDTALSQKIASADYGAFVIKTCDGQAASLKSGLVGFDVKNGVKRTQASTDAQAQIDDYVAMSSEKYADRAPVKKTVATATVATPAAAPVPAKP